MPNISPKQFNLWYRYLSYSCETHIITCHNVCSKEFLTVSKAISSGKHPFSWHLQNNWYYSQHDRVTSGKSRKWHWVGSRPFQWVMIVIPKKFTQGFSQFMYMIWALHYSNVIMSAMASQITSLISVYSTVSGADKIKLESSAPLAFVRGIHRRPVNSPHKWPVTRKRFPFDDVIMDHQEVEGS